MRFEHGRHSGRHKEAGIDRCAIKMMAMMGGRFGGPFGEGPFGGRGHGGGRGGPDGGGRGRRGARMFAGGELRLLLLHLVAEQPRHGYDLIRAVGDLAGGEYAPSPGVVYPTLALLVDEGLIAEEVGEGPRKAFAVTEAGRAELAARQAEIDTIVARLKEVGDQRERSDSPPVRRAMGNLHAVLRNRAVAGFEPEAAHAIADILDEAARKIERL
ncbi:DNA-binding PadR family transcriptional regulator [Novosphingobium hassiacum]|uniref:DNA-binding PadR family transcriptional regulator n=1 Tax=Novosphingobium hassiacum TaxID=173676 RepID=A0A7W5ZXD2_9SPHN|nr:PadR family transcriptional regulator [Novosphingobium hassiacum]MBB3860863.1 DNA-binding PadR family transcriptional regulator [Novosphingobium hassiacum]